MRPSEPLLLTEARGSDVAREAFRRVQDWLASLPDGKRWTRMDWLFASAVAVLAISSSGFLTATLRTVQSDPDYFFRRLVASYQGVDLDMMETGSVDAGATGADPGGGSATMPVPAIHRKSELRPSDYEIVMIFSDEVLLATGRELMRAKVGSVLPGLGQMLGIDGANTVRFERATLTEAAPRP